MNNRGLLKRFLNEKHQMKNLLLFDYYVDASNKWVQIFNTVSGVEWQSKYKVLNCYHGSIWKNCLRYIGYFTLPLSIVVRRKQWHQIVGVQQFFALNFAFWCRLFHLKKVNEVIVLTFIYKRRKGFVGDMYHKYMRYMVESRYVDKLVVFSHEECRYYASIFKNCENKFVFTPYGIEPVSIDDIADEGFLFAAGRSNRNYDFMLNMLSDSSYNVKIACDSYHKKVKDDHIQILTNCYGNDMLKIMAKCHCVLVPLEDLNISSGQLVILQAMSLGKPVVCTDADGIKDYVNHGVTGYVVDNDVNEWKRCLKQLNDNLLYEKMAKAAKSEFIANYTRTAMLERVARICTI